MDPCRLTMRFKSSDLEQFEEILGEKFWDHKTEPTFGQTEIVAYEANLAWPDQRMIFAKQGLMFYGHHGHGHEYSAQLFVAFSNELVEVRSDHTEEVLIRVMPDGLPNMNELLNAKRYFQLMELVELTIEIEL